MLVQPLKEASYIHIHHIQDPRYSESVGYHVVEIYCHGCNDGAYILMDKDLLEGEINDGGVPHLRAYKDYFVGAHAECRPTGAEVLGRKCPGVNLANKTVDMRSVSE